MGIKFRSYREVDLDAIHALDVICFERQFRFTRSAMRHFAEAKNARVVIAEEIDALAGFAILHIEEADEERVGYIVTLDVVPHLRRTGVASVLMSEIERQARMDGCAALTLHVFTGNDAAIRFYAGISFVRLHRSEGFYGPGVDAWTYRKLLRSLNE